MASARMPVTLSLPTFAVVGLGMPARVTMGTCREISSIWPGSSTPSCRISPSLLRAIASTRRPASWSVMSTERSSRSKPRRCAARSTPRLSMSWNCSDSVSSANAS